MNNSVKNTLIEVITKRNAVKLIYTGDSATGIRVGFPHALYYTNSTGKTKVDVYQISGDSASSIPGWKPFDVDYIRSIEIIPNSHFAIQNGYKPDSGRYKNCIVQVDMNVA